ncbi:MAG: hypothetical protein ACRDYB_01475 [Acidimicrobiales bacterium]
MTPRREVENLRRLSAALEELDARFRMDDLDEGLAFDHDAASLAGMAMLNLTCAAGTLDIAFRPQRAPTGFDELVGSSVRIRVGQEDVLRSMEEVGRDKDIRAALVLREFLRDRLS